MSTPEGDTQTPTKHRYTIDLADGKTQTYEADTETELLEKVNGAHQESVRAMKIRERENAQLRNQIDTQPAPAAPPTATPAAAPAAPSADPRKQFSPDHYYQMLSSDPIAAQDYLDHFRYGFDPREKWKSLDRFEQTNQHLTDSMSVQEFHRRIPDFPATEEAAEALNNRVQQLGMGVSANSLELAWHQLVRDGAVEPSSNEESAEAMAPPATESVSRSAGDDAFDPYNVSMDELRKRIATEGRSKR